MPKVTINDRTVDVEPGTNLVQAALKTGIQIPHYCYHPRLSIVGQCRMCLVAVQGMPAEEGGDVRGHRRGTLDVQEMAGARGRAVFHLRQPGTKQAGDLHPERLGIGAAHRQRRLGDRACGSWLVPSRRRNGPAAPSPGPSARR